MGQLFQYGLSVLTQNLDSDGLMADERILYMSTIEQWNEFTNKVRGLQLIYVKCFLRM